MKLTSEENKEVIEFLFNEQYVINSKFNIIFHDGQFDLIFNAHRGMVTTKFVNIVDKVSEIKVNHTTSSAFILWDLDNYPELKFNS